MDKHYRFIRSVEPSCTYQATSDMHEFYLTDDGERALMTQYIRSVHDLCPWGLCDGLGYIQSSGFQEISVEAGECIFSWTSLDHISPKDSFVTPSSTEVSGSGESPDSPWDYFHINSVDKSAFDDGYLISARHMCAIYKINGNTGDVVWQIGGKKNQYDYDNEMGEIEFGFQHDARWISDSAEESVISVFDNGSDGFDETAGHSTGKIIRLDHRNKIARLVERPLDPPFVDGHAHLAKSQGNFQLNLPGYNTDLDVGGEQLKTNPGNRILGYGNDPFFSEYAWVSDEFGSGHWEIVFYGTLAWGNMMNYRVLKFDNWVGVPLTKPALWSYSQSGIDNTTDNGNQMVLYTSWNGHTQIKTFAFYGSNSAHVGRTPYAADWQLLVSGWPKTGFETIYRHGTTYQYVYVEAFDANEVSLGRSQVMNTFVPSSMMQKYCDDLACAWMDFENENREAMRQDMKEKYDLWLLSQGDDSGGTDGYLSSQESATGARTKAVKVLGYVLSFIILGMVLAGLMVTSLRTYHTNRWVNEKMIQVVGLKTRVRGMAHRGHYSKVDPGLSTEDLDGQLAESSVTRTLASNERYVEIEPGLDRGCQPSHRAHLS